MFFIKHRGGGGEVHCFTISIFNRVVTPGDNAISPFEFQGGVVSSCCERSRSISKCEKNLTLNKTSEIFLSAVAFLRVSYAKFNINLIYKKIQWSSQLEKSAYGGIGEKVRTHFIWPCQFFPMIVKMLLSYWSMLFGIVTAWPLDHQHLVSGSPKTGGCQLHSAKNSRTFPEKKPFFPCEP